MIESADFTDNQSRYPVDNEHASGHIVLRLADKTTHDAEDLLEVAQHHGFEDLKAFLNTNDHLSARRMIRHSHPREVRERERMAEQSAFAPLQSLTAYWRLDVCGEVNPESIRRQLHGMPEISVAYHEGMVVDAGSPAGTAGANPYYTDQLYLKAAPQGLGVQDAWSRAPCSGNGVRAIDLESGWILQHEDLPKPALLYGDNLADQPGGNGNHGAAAMGVVAGVDNHVGIIGMAPALDSLAAVSHFDAATGTSLHVADAITAAMKHLQAGDILLLEVQRSQGGNGYPVEIDSADLHAIRLAVAHGIIVVEAAGNGGQDLDDWTDAAGEHSLDTQSGGFNDSGAIMVGSCNSAVETGPGGTAGHSRYYSSNHGSRVDVYAWGQSIVTAGYGTLAGGSGASDSYASNFGQTSGASAIIAGAAALLQSWRSNAGETPLTPAQMRNILSDPATGTPQVQVSGDPIGVMPDLDAILSSA